MPMTADLHSTLNVAKRRAGGDEIVPDFVLDSVFENIGHQPARSASSSWKDRYQQIARSRASSVGSSSAASSPASAYLSRINSRLSVSGDHHRLEQVELDSSLTFKLGPVIGSGGFSVVRKAWNSKGKVYALKIVDKKVGDISQEIEIWKALDHRNILPLLSAHETHQSWYLVSEYFRSGTLFDFVRNSRSDLPYNQIQAYLLQLVSAVRYMHAHNIIHRDIKPENCLVTESKLQLCDFGLSEYASTSADPKSPKIGPAPSSAALPAIHQLEANGGSFLFASPELLEGEASFASDVWALGVVFYSCLTASYPWQHSLLPKLKAMIKSDDYDSSKLPVNAQSVVETCLQKDPAQRPTVAALEESCQICWSTSI